MIRPDHVKHFFVCFMLSALLLTAAQWRPVLSIVAVLAVGIIKEFKDIRTTGFDWTDILADIAGIASAVLLWALTMIGG